MIGELQNECRFLACNQLCSVHLTHLHFCGVCVLLLLLSLWQIKWQTTRMEQSTRQYYTSDNDAAATGPSLDTSNAAEPPAVPPAVSAVPAVPDDRLQRLLPYARASFRSFTALLQQVASRE